MLVAVNIFVAIILFVLFFAMRFKGRQGLQDKYAHRHASFKHKQGEANPSMCGILEGCKTEYALRYGSPTRVVSTHERGKADPNTGALCNPYHP